MKKRLLSSLSGFMKKSSHSMATFLRIALMSKWSGILKSKNTERKKSCVLVGNGPSFRATLEKYSGELQHHDLVCVNSFVATDYFVQLEPAFYIVNATIVFLPDEKQSETYRNLKREIFDGLLKTSWPMEIMVPFMAKRSVDFQKLLKANQHLKPLYYNHTPIEGYDWLKNLLFKMGLGTPRPHNVLIPAIMNMIYLNYDQIILIGADHSWLKDISVNEKNEALVNQKHFYDENESRALTMNDRERPRRLHEMVDKFLLSFRGYWEIKPYSDKKGVMIYNCSEESMIDAFERKKLNELDFKPESNGNY